MFVWGNGHGERPAANRSLKTTDVDALSSRMSQKEGTEVATVYYSVKFPVFKKNSTEFLVTKIC